MVFAPCRPRYANDLINLSDAFVGAWLPGSEGKGVADVLFAGVDGKPAHDFSGTLSFAWPAVACPGPRAEGPDGAAPLFALGHGLSYATPGDVAHLPVDHAESCGESTHLTLFNLTSASTLHLHVATAPPAHPVRPPPNPPP